MPDNKPQWEQITPPPNMGEYDFALATDKGGDLYLFGGRNVGPYPDYDVIPHHIASRYSFADDTWTAITPTPEFRLGMAAASDGKDVYLFVNRDAQDTPFTWRYSPATDTYTALTPPPVADYSIGASIGGGVAWVQIYRYFYRYDLATDMWQRRNDTGAGIFMPVAAVGSRDVYELYAYGDFSTLYHYDVPADTWETLAAPYVKGEMALVPLPGGQLAAVSAVHGSGTTQEVDIYAGGTWDETSVPPVPISGSFQSAVYSTAGYLVVAIGTSSGTLVYKYPFGSSPSRYLRMVQRDDIHGVTRHPRALGGGRGSASAAEMSGAPRVGLSNRYR